MTRKKRIIIISSVVAVLLVGGVAAWLLIGDRVFENNGTSNQNNSRDDPPQYSKETYEIQQQTPSLESIEEFRNAYGESFEVARYDVNVSDPTKWDKEMLDKVYFVLNYNHHVGEHRTNSHIFEQLDAAAAAGINLDNNSLGFNEEYRTKLRNETNHFLETGTSSLSAESEGRE